MRFWRALAVAVLLCFPAPRERSSCSCRWTTSRESSQGVRPHVRRDQGGRHGRVAAELSRRLVPAPRHARVRRHAGLDGITIEALDDGALNQIRGEMANGNMDAVPLEKAPKIAVYTPPERCRGTTR